MLIAWLGWGRNRNKDVSDNSAVIATMQATLTTSTVRLEDVLRKLDKIQDYQSSLSRQLAVLDSSYGSMHKRQDEMSLQIRELTAAMHVLQAKE